MQLSPEEKQYFDKIVAISGQSKEIVKIILRSILISLTMRIYSYEENIKKKPNAICDFSIPYIGKMLFSFDEDILKKNKAKNMKIKISASKILLLEMEAILNGESPPTTQFHLHKIAEKLQKDLEIDTLISNDDQKNPRIIL